MVPTLATKGRPDDQALRHPGDPALRRGPAADGNLLPLPGSLRGGAAAKVVAALLARGLAREEVTDLPDPRRQRAQHVWRNEDDGRAVLLRITPAGLEAIGIERDDEPDAAPASEIDRRRRARRSTTGSTPAPTRPANRRPARRPAEAPKKRGRSEEV